MGLRETLGDAGGRISGKRRHGGKERLFSCFTRLFEFSLILGECMRFLVLLLLLSLVQVGCQSSSTGGVAVDGEGKKIEIEKFDSGEFGEFKQYPRWKYNPKRRIRPRIKTV